MKDDIAGRLEDTAKKLEDTAKRLEQNNILLRDSIDRLLVILGRWRQKRKRNHKPHVHIDEWGGTSVDPSVVFRTERGKKDLEAIAELDIPSKVRSEDDNQV
jgi:hypothetical protein